MRDQELRRALLAAAPPDELGAQRRAWQIARTAFEEREPTPWPKRHQRALVFAAGAVAVLAAILSPTGRAVITDVREAIGTETRVAGVPQARPSLFSLPASGRLLTTAGTGPWIVAADGAKRRLGDYEAAAWSPRGQFLVVTKRSQVVAVTPQGEVRWSLSRPRVGDATWAPSGFRVAYRSGVNLRIVAGDGTGDRRFDSSARVAPAWQPGEEHVLAYVTQAGTLTVAEVDTPESRWTAGLRGTPRHLEWSADGSRILSVTELGASRFALTLFGEGGRRLQSLAFPGTFVDAAFAPVEDRIALVRTREERSELLTVNARSIRDQQPVFEGAGRFSGVAWSPDASWLLLGWESADQWLFFRSADVEKIKAVSSLTKQFDPAGSGARDFPRIEGWCCPG